jgi:hypothetical protein
MVRNLPWTSRPQRRCDPRLINPPFLLKLTPITFRLVLLQLSETESTPPPSEINKTCEFSCQDPVSLADYAEANCPRDSPHSGHIQCIFDFIETQWRLNLGHRARHFEDPQELACPRAHCKISKIYHDFAVDGDGALHPQWFIRMEFQWPKERPRMRFYHNQQMSPRQGSPPTPDQSPLGSEILVVSPSAFVAARRAVSPSPLGPATAIITPTLMDLTNDPAYLVSPGGSSAGAFSDPSIQNAGFGDSDEEGPESGAFRRMTASQILRSTDEELAGEPIEVVSD